MASNNNKVLYVGVSDTPAWVVSQANTLAELRGWTRFVGLQIRYSLVDRTVERELLPMARALDLTVTPWGIVGSGVLTGKYNTDPNTEGRASMRGQISERNLRIAAEVVEVAREVDATPSQVAIAWVCGGEGNIVPLVGAKTVVQLADNLGALEVTLSEAHLKRLDDVSTINIGFPHDMLRPQSQATAKRMDNHRASTTPEW